MLSDLLTSKAGFDNQYRKNKTTLIAGVDEAGRGPLAGPVVAAAVIIHDCEALPYINDSKKISEKKRQLIFLQLQSMRSITIGVGIVDEALVDEMNIFQATLFAMKKAVANLQVFPDVVLIDGSFAPALAMPTHTIVKGDMHSLSIGAASIIAKQTRDNIMIDLDKKWPMYGFKQHKGYPTRLHKERLKEYGPCACHRYSFSPVKLLK
ncbi:ribonuclease HII [Candidatus Aerophobetes bacterium]|uniref:Ribonuclease HII n=1 Tax=Aerophobetes bacterium TaxID=2030807 RepID=A0A2A4X6G1_UNCAE|nr:MAG: ribonuclease HII [Candidatus Aerophobetes bacterium]